LTVRIVLPSKKPSWIALIVLLGFHTLLLSVQTNKRFDTSFVRGWLLDSLGPFEKLTDLGAEGVENVWHGYFALVGEHRENLRLHSENDALRLELATRQEDALELARLHQLMDMRAAIGGKTVVARIIGRSPASGSQTLTIDKGSSSGVMRGSTILTAEGIVGRVIFAGNNYSIIQLILDSQSAVGFVVRSSRRIGILKGSGATTLEMEYIEDDNEIQQGDELLSSGQDQIYPKGLSLGFVVYVGPRQGNFKTVRIRPSVNFAKLEEVLCMTDAELSIGQAP
jgi:rod shape-determining protein MreC